MGDSGWSNTGTSPIRSASGQDLWGAGDTPRPLIGWSHSFGKLGAGSGRSRDLSRRRRGEICWFGGCSIPGTGALFSSALAATTPDVSSFRTRRDYAAGLGLTPRPHSSGGKERLGRIAKAGKRYPYRLLYLGLTARISALRAVKPGRVRASRMLERKLVKSSLSRWPTAWRGSSVGRFTKARSQSAASQTPYVWSRPNRCQAIRQALRERPYKDSEERRRHATVLAHVLVERGFLHADGARTAEMAAASCPR